MTRRLSRTLADCGAAAFGLALLLIVEWLFSMPMKGEVKQAVHGLLFLTVGYWFGYRACEKEQQ